MTDAKIGDDAVAAATGREWSEWIELLDDWGAAEKGHAATARHLAAEHGLSGWWSQMVTVHYERTQGLREVGETASGHYQVGVQRTVHLAPDEAWERLTGADGLAAWLGDGAPSSLEEGTDYTLADGTTGEVRVVRDGSHVRLTWQPEGWRAPSTLQVRVNEAASGRATLSFHHEQLPDAEHREALREHWRDALDRLVELDG